MIFLLVHYKNYLYSFSIPALTNYHKFSGLNADLLFYGSGGQKYKMGFTGLKSGCQQSCVSSGSSRNKLTS